RAGGERCGLATRGASGRGARSARAAYSRRLQAYTRGVLHFSGYGVAAMTDDRSTRYAAEIAAAREALDGFMTAFNAEDAEAMRTRWFHCPHVRFHSGEVTVMPTPADFHNLVWGRQGEAAGWARTAWDFIELIDAGPGKVHFRVQF